LFEIGDLKSDITISEQSFLGRTRLILGHIGRTRRFAPTFITDN